MPRTAPWINPENAYIFRILHADNLEWVLENGFHSRNSGRHDPDFVTIGDVDLIDKRQSWSVDHELGGVLGDYIPFYFTPFSPMMYRIISGHNVRQRDRRDIVIAVAALRQLARLGMDFLFTDRHASLVIACFFSSVEDLSAVDWTILQNRDFRRDDTDKVERYQAEALIKGHLPTSALERIVCYDSARQRELSVLAQSKGCDVEILARPEWYF